VPAPLSIGDVAAASADELASATWRQRFMGIAAINGGMTREKPWRWHRVALTWRMA
jgi:hypothetical protein